MINIIYSPIYQLYLLQLENYELKRFWNLLIKKGYFFIGQTLRNKVDWKLKPIIIFILSILIVIILNLVLDLNPVTRAMIIIVLWILFPLIYSFLIILLYPVEVILKKIIIERAINKIRSNKQLKIVGIAGSYGKTTMKNVLASTLSQKFNILSSPDSVNTPLGIACWLLKSFNKNTDVLILEMGEHYEGDIKQLCNYFYPNLAVITGINESHLERLESIDTTIKTIFELVRYSKDKSTIILYADDKNVLNNYKQFIGEKSTIFYSINDTKYKIITNRFDQGRLLWYYELDNFGKLSLPILGEYAIGNVIASIKIGKILGMTEREIKQGIANIQPVKHRLEPIVNPLGIIVIDDSYNGNPEGVTASINLLNKFKGKRKIFLTPGLVETGRSMEKIHTEIGHQLIGADLVLLIKNSVTFFIEKGLLEKGFNKNKIVYFDNAEEAHRSLKDILRPDDVIVFQNDWGDQYI